MARIIKLAKSFGTLKLLQLTKKLSDDERNELFEYIGNLERSQRSLARALGGLLDKFTTVVENPTDCYCCHGEGCNDCKPKTQEGSASGENAASTWLHKEVIHLPRSI